MKNHLDYLIIGGGPAGIQLGYFLQKNGSDYLILEKGNNLELSSQNFLATAI
jgi:cation diffusion facilitator CzcD-associated flavoprotein CzcO